MAYSERNRLQPSKIAGALGPSSEAAGILVRALVGALEESSDRTAELFAAWQEVFGRDRRLFALHTYYALVIKLLAADVLQAARADTKFSVELAATDSPTTRDLLTTLESNRRFRELGVHNVVEGDLFSWYLQEWTDEVDAGVQQLASTVAQFDVQASPSTATDLFKPLYQRLVPEHIRHDLGEYYTPDWLADYVLQQSGFVDEPQRRFLDPACGSGTFLMRALGILQKHCGEPAELLDHVREQNFAGLDLNPLAVLAARANLIVSLAEELARADEPLTLPVYLADSIRPPKEFTAQLGRYDFVIGNPPWVAWSDLPERYRASVKGVCEHYDIFSDDAWVGGIESDISTVMTYAVADRLLKDGGTLGFLITQSVFKTKSAQGFRRFELPDDTPLGVFHVDDLSALEPFDGATTRTAALFLRRGQPTEYPVPYRVWRGRDTRELHEARPVDLDGGAWITAPEGHTGALQDLLGGEGLHARKGTTTDFNNIFWVTVDEVRGEVATVTNNLSHLGHQVAQESFPIEKALLYPLARGQHIGRFRVDATDRALILAQKEMRAFDEETMRASYPSALAYFQAHREDACIGCRASSDCSRGLADRSSYANAKYHDAMGEFWAVWNVGEYTFAPYKVAWKEVSSGFEAAVLSRTTLGGLGQNLHIPDHKLMFVPCEVAQQAHYLCGVLNSKLVRTFAESVSLSTSRGARLFERLNVPPFDASAPAHLAIAALSEQAHTGERELDAAFEAELDRAVAVGLERAQTSSGRPNHRNAATRK